MGQQLNPIGLRLGINRSLWVFGFLQMISTAGFALLAEAGQNIAVLTAVISFENLSAGMEQQLLQRLWLLRPTRNSPQRNMRSYRV